MDCVSDAGDVFIGYVATVRWKAFSLNYSSILLQTRGEISTTHTSLRAVKVPEFSLPTIEWSSEPLRTNASWTADCMPIERTIFDSDAGDVKWLCIAPIAEAEVNVAGKPFCTGLGYVEHLSMSIAPWQLPIDELRWGRYLSKHEHLTWIEWRGPNPLTFVFHNGKAVVGAEVCDDAIMFGDRRLTIVETDRRVLREGQLSRTTLAMIPGVRKLIPHRILDAHEIKWCSKGTMNHAGVMESKGWAIHEVVTWAR